MVAQFLTTDSEVAQQELASPAPRIPAKRRTHKQPLLIFECLCCSAKPLPAFQRELSDYEKRTHQIAEKAAPLFAGVRNG